MKQKANTNSKVKFHFGCGNNYLDDWINVDNNISNFFDKIDINWDFKTYLPFKENCADIIFDEDFLERLRLGEKAVVTYLTCYRYILKPKGVFKIELYDMKFKPQLEPWLKKLGFKNLEFCKTQINECAKL